MAFAKVFKGRRVFITGHTGFKGAWLSLWLAELGAKVYGYALAPPTKPSLFEDADIANCLAGHQVADVRDAGCLLEAVRATQPEIVFHLAAQPLVRTSYAEPRETYETNVMGTVNLLEALRAVDSVRVCQVITSDKCYENREWVYAYRENDSLGGHDPYSNSKACVELVVSSYRNAFFSPMERDGGVSLASCRAGNVIGGGDWAEDRIIPDCIRALSESRPVQVRNPDAIRPWQHVLEPLSGYLWLAARQWQEPARYADAWNFGPISIGNIPVRRIVEQAVQAWGQGEWHCAHSQQKSATLHEANYLKLDCTKANTLLDWLPVYNVTECINHTVDWYRHWHANSQFDAKAFTLGQVRAYMSQAQGAGQAWALGEEDN